MPPRLRRAAIEELARHRISSLAIHDLDSGATDFLKRQAQWGIELAGSRAYGWSYGPSLLIQIFLYLTICPWSCKLSGSSAAWGVYCATRR